MSYILIAIESLIQRTKTYKRLHKEAFELEQRLMDQSDHYRLELEQERRVTQELRRRLEDEVSRRPVQDVVVLNPVQLHKLREQLPQLSLSNGTDSHHHAHLTGIQRVLNTLQAGFTSA